MRRHGGARFISSQLNNCRRIVVFIQFGLFTLILLDLSMVNSTTAVDQGEDTEKEEEKIFFNSKSGRKNGTFASPRFPNYYPPNARTRFEFQADEEEVVWINWDTFVLEDPFSANSLCMRDYVEVIVIDYNGVQHVSGRYCGNNRPPDFKTMQQKVVIIFQSSYTKHYQGFKGTFHFKNEKELPAPASRYHGKQDPQAYGCGGLFNTGFGGVIQSPGYPATYPENVECNWVIRVNPAKKVYVRILELQLATSKMDCTDAQLLVIDGYAHYVYENFTTPHEKHMVRFCGEDKYYKEEGARSYMSTKNRMVIRFNTTKPPAQAMRLKREEYGSPIGFYLVWTEVLPVDDTNPGYSSCEKFLCKGGDYCLDETQQVCADRKRYCIDRSLLCDGIPNCAEHDESDEENCYSKEIVAAGASLFLLLVLIIVAVICCQKRRGRKQLEYIRRATGQSSRSTSAVGATPLNATSNINSLLSEDTQLLRSSTVNKLESNSIGQRTTDITAFPQNYHPARSSAAAGIVDDKQPYLSVPNHLPVYSAAPVISKRSIDQPSVRQEKLVTLSPEETVESSLSISESGSILRRRQGGPAASTSTSPPSTRVPLIKVMSAPEAGGDVWEEQGDDRPVVCAEKRPMQRRANVDSSSVTWTYEPISYSPTPANIRQHDADRILGGTDQSAGAVEMVTFNAATCTKQPTYSIPNQRPPAVKPQGILKSSTSLPASGDQRADTGRTTACVVISDSIVGRKTVVPAPPPQIPSANAVKPPPPSYSQALARLGRQKAVEFVDELPKRHEMVQQSQSSLPPLLLSPPSASSNPNAVNDPSTNDDRSPSPWHKLKPSVV